MKIKHGYTGFGVPVGPSRNCVRSARFLVDAQLNCESPGGVALGSLSSDDEPPPVMPDYVIDFHSGDIVDVESLYTPAAGGHEPVSLSARRQRSRSPRARMHRSIKELLMSPSIDSGDASSDAFADSDRESDAAMLPSELDTATGADTDDVHADAPVQSGCLSESDEDVAAPAPAAWGLSESSDEAPPPASRPRSRSCSSSSSTSTSSSSSTSADAADARSEDSLDAAWSVVVEPVPTLTQQVPLSSSSPAPVDESPAAVPARAASPFRSMSPEARSETSRSSRDNSASPRPKVRGPHLTPLARLPDPEFQPDIAWWAQPIWNYFSSLIKRYPRQPRRPIRLELKCAGTGGEIEGPKVPQAFIVVCAFVCCLAFLFCSSLNKQKQTRGAWTPLSGSRCSREERVCARVLDVQPRGHRAHLQRQLGIF